MKELFCGLLMMVVSKHSKSDPSYSSLPVLSSIFLLTLSAAASLIRHRLLSLSFFPRYYEKMRKRRCKTRSLLSCDDDCYTLVDVHDMFMLREKQLLEGRRRQALWRTEWWFCIALTEWWSVVIWNQEGDFCSLCFTCFHSSSPPAASVFKNCRWTHSFKWTKNNLLYPSANFAAVIGVLSVQNMIIMLCKREDTSLDIRNHIIAKILHTCRY